MDSNIFKSLGILPRSNANVEAVEGDGTTVYYVDLFPSERAECPLCGARGAAHGYYFKKARMPSNRFHESAAYVRVPRFSCPNVRCAPFGKASSAKLAGIGKGRSIPMAVYAQIVLSLKEPKTVAAIAKEYKVSSALVSKDLDDVVPDFGRGGARPAHRHRRVQVLVFPRRRAIPGDHMRRGDGLGHRRHQAKEV